MSGPKNDGLSGPKNDGLSGPKNDGLRGTDGVSWPKNAYAWCGEIRLARNEAEECTYVMMCLPMSTLWAMISVPIKPPILAAM